MADRRSKSTQNHPAGSPTESPCRSTHKITLQEHLQNQPAGTPTESSCRNTHRITLHEHARNHPAGTCTESPCRNMHTITLQKHPQNQTVGIPFFDTFESIMIKVLTYGSVRVYIYMSHFTYECKMWYPLNLVLESWEYLWFY